jgi:hypothetical protein
MIRKNFETMNRLSGEMESVLLKIDRGKGLLGAMVSDKNDGNQMLRNLSSAGASVREAANSTQATAEMLGKLVEKYSKAGGAVPRLFIDRDYGDQTLASIRDASAQLDEILRKINSGRGRIGMAVNNPELYNNATAFWAAAVPVVERESSTRCMALRIRSPIRRRRRRPTSSWCRCEPPTSRHTRPIPFLWTPTTMGTSSTWVCATALLALVTASSAVLSEDRVTRSELRRPENGMRYQRRRGPQRLRNLGARSVPGASRGNRSPSRCSWTR